MLTNTILNHIIIIRILSALIISILIAQDVLFSQVQAQLQQQQRQLQAGRLIKIPLIREITAGAGSFGQPIISYYAPLHIGTPVKKYNIQFDVGYSDLFLPHYTWNPFKVNLHYGKGFLCKESSTCVKTDREYTSNCQNNKITGKPYEDLMTLSSAYRGSSSSTSTSFTSSGYNNNNNNNSLHGLEQQQQQQHHFSPPIQLPISFRQNFLAASDASDAKFRYLPIDGYFGLSPNARSFNVADLVNPLVSLKNALLIDNLQFSFWFNPVLDSNQGGELVLGGVDMARYQGQIFWHNLADMNGFWTINLQQVTLGGQNIDGCQSPHYCTATISSAINEVYGPQSQVKRIYDLLNTVKSSDGDGNSLQLIDCRRIGQLPILTLNMDGIPYSLLPSNYIRKTSDQSAFKTETCYVAILPLSGGGGGQSSQQWILGTNFLGAYYSIYDLTYRQIGFASLR